MGVLKIDLVFIKYSAFFSFEFLSNGVYAWNMKLFDSLNIFFSVSLPIFIFVFNCPIFRLSGHYSFSSLVIASIKS